MESPPVYSNNHGHPPPNYTTHTQSSDQPPTYIFPKTFVIGQSKTTPPLVTTNQLKNHLGLLHAFAKLRNQIDALEINDYPGIPFLPEDKERRWCWFVAQAVERFSIWCHILTHVDSTRPAEDILPPLDVLMVWHAYMLNPRWYAEDCARLSELQGLKDFTTLLSHSLSSNLKLAQILASEPAHTRMKTWTKRTRRSFDPLQDAESHQSRTVLCPKCRHPTIIPYMNAEGTGFFQSNFEVKCADVNCTLGPPITRSSLSARRLVEDLARTGLDSGENAACLPGTLRTLQKAADVANGNLSKQAILRASLFEGRPSDEKGLIEKEKWILSVLEKSEFDLKPLRLSMGLKMKGNGGTLLKRIMSAYEGSYIFSVELVGAVIRQGSFVKKMHDLQWTQPHFFDSKEDEVALQHAIARYHAFLDLISASPASFYVPTLDIDLAWHTHQLLGETYQSNCQLYVGRYVDHDDKVEENVLSTSFDLTCRAWLDRYGIPYTHCGCPLPGSTIGQRISRLIQQHITKNPPWGLIPPAREDLLSATHPSEHNAVFVWDKKHSSTNLQQTRRDKFRKRQERDAKERAKAKLPPVTSEQRRRMEEHEAAFLIPIPLYYGYAVGTCAAYGGNVVYSANNVGMGGCAVGGGACAVGGGCSGGCSGGGCGGGGCGGGGCGGGCGG